jgi:hypothetical protein
MRWSASLNDRAESLRGARYAPQVTVVLVAIAGALGALTRYALDSLIGRSTTTASRGRPS